MKMIENEYTNSIFENIKRIDDYGNEYWYARELQKILEYKDWRKFQKVIDKAILSANNSVSNKEDWAVEVNKPIKTGKGKEYIIKGFAMYDERLKNSGSILTEKYFVFSFLFPPII